MANMIEIYYTGGGDAKVVGEETNRVYWFYSGKPTEVHEDDAEALLAQKVIKTCCGTKIERTIYPFQTG